MPELDWAIVGGVVALSGAAYQGLFRNPLADPYLVGVAAGAGLGAAIVIHVTMLFRGALFRNLGTEGRRSRAWKARM